MKTIVIHGGGYVGLTSAVHYARSGVWNVIVYDPDTKTVVGINSGKPRAGEFLGYIDQQVSELVEKGTLSATQNFDHVDMQFYHSIAVPSEKNGEPYDEIVLSVLRKLFDSTTGPQEVVILIESTLTPGTIEKIISEIPMHIALAVCPRRDWFADETKNLKTLPRIVGGINEYSTKRAVEVLSTVSDDIRTTDYETAEICKALENALLHIPVVFAHQLAFALPDKNIREALALAGTHWRLSPLHLGFGTGGRCVPLGTKYLVQAAEHASALYIGQDALTWDEEFRNVVAGVISRNTQYVDSIDILGAGYRPDFKDIGLSASVGIAKILATRNRLVTLIDPLWDPVELTKLTGVLCVRQMRGSLPHSIILATPHKEFLSLPETNPELFKNCKYILDAQGTWKKYEYLFSEWCIKYQVVGEPDWLN